MDMNVYNYMLSGYNMKPATRYSSHKNSELRSVLHDIAKKTKSSPIYLVKLSDKLQSYALDVKETSMSLNEAFQKLYEQDDNAIFSQKKAVSSDEEQVGVEIKTDDYDQLPSPFRLTVHSLAKSQINETKDFYNSSMSLPSGTYRFQVSVDDFSYDFQYNIKKDANHEEVIGGLSDFISKAKIGIRATGISREAGKIAMRLESDSTGTVDGNPIMKFQDIPGDYEQGIVDYYGLNEMIQEPENASFSINDTMRSAMTNEFTLARSLHISMHRASEDAALIEYVPDSDKILEGVSGIMDSYNQMVDSSWKYSGADGTMPKLVREMRSVFGPYLNDLEAAGLSFEERGRMVMDESLAKQAALDGTFQDLFGQGSALSMRMMAKTNTVKLDPMDYVDKTLVSYPDYSKPPRGYSYTTSLYSGMLFNYYC